mgnify:CR=1 FL=1
MIQQPTVGKQILKKDGRDFWVLEVATFFKMAAGLIERWEGSDINNKRPSGFLKASPHGYGQSRPPKIAYI